MVMTQEDEGEMEEEHNRLSFDALGSQSNTGPVCYYLYHSYSIILAYFFYLNTLFSLELHITSYICSPDFSFLFWHAKILTFRFNHSNLKH